MIHGVKTRKLRVNCDERGRLMEMLRRDDPEMDATFGQAYLTTAYPGVVKAWHYHQFQTDHFVCLRGMVKVVLYDPREDSPTKGEVNEFFLGDFNPSIVEIPALVYHGFKNIGTEECLLINLTTNTYNYQNPDEHRVAPHSGEIPYNWGREDK